MSTKQSTVYIARPGSILKSILSPDATEEPARSLAFESLEEAESYVTEMADRAKLHEFYLTEAKCKEDELHVLTGFVWDLNVCYMVFMDGHQQILAEIERVPMGA